MKGGDDELNPSKHAKAELSLSLTATLRAAFASAYSNTSAFSPHDSFVTL